MPGKGEFPPSSSEMPEEPEQKKEPEEDREEFAGEVNPEGEGNVAYYERLDKVNRDYQEWKVWERALEIVKNADPEFEASFDFASVHPGIDSIAIGLKHVERDAAFLFWEKDDKPENAFLIIPLRYGPIPARNPERLARSVIKRAEKAYRNFLKSRNR